MEAAMRQIGTLALLGVMAIGLLSACDDGASCDMDPDQPDCPEEEYVEPTPTPVPSMQLFVTGTNGGAYAGATLRAIVSDGYQPLWTSVLCGQQVLDAAGTFAFASGQDALAHGAEYYSLELLTDLDGDSELDVEQGEHRWSMSFNAPTHGSALHLVFDFAVEQPYESWAGPWGDNPNSPVVCP
jgi:hypothetical protein